MKSDRYRSGSGRSSRLSSLLVIALLSLIAVMLIVPDLDSPDIAYPANAAPAVIHGIHHHISHGNQQSRAFDAPLRLGESSDSLLGRLANIAELPALESHQILRC